ncbi:flavin reductase family protein [Aliiroseovarius sp. S1339]|uniref:flavin reductase family protein n=1 Tax=Aliiroseovarius sp. S1339 TaxID=2936990 RepID=UPI0020C02D87|nr:flavin reductase family protein [Aliiroseovarius sp. S1339]MCK8463654.1 flavin reductase family protein [Aliiroseovarius sp. S1339]
MTNFTPSPDHAGAFRAALGLFTTGVTLVTTSTPRGPLAMTVNSFTSVSLDPPLILWCPAKVSARHDAFVAAEHFAVHLLCDDQVEVARRFARQGEDFSDLDHRVDYHGVPVIEHCMARFDCTRENVVDGGDHSIVLGRVHRVTTNEGQPLTFHAGRFGGFGGLV